MLNAQSISFVYTYYNQPKLLERLIEIWRTYPSKILKKIEFIIIDDGSEAYPVDEVTFPDDLNVSIYRIKKDIACNTGGARNLGMNVARSRWSVLMDLDHYFDQSNMCKLLEMKKKPENSYYFSRFKVSEGSFIKPSATTLMIQKEDFWKSGGYDEDFSGSYGKDDSFFIYHLKKNIKMTLINDLFVTVVDPLDSEYVIKNNIYRNAFLKSASPRNAELFTMKTADKNYKNGAVLRFPWEKIISKRNSGNKFKHSFQKILSYLHSIRSATS